MSLLQRYLEPGQQLAVYYEILELGDAVSKEPVRVEALEVARESVRRVYHNLRLLQARLTEAGYVFVRNAPLVAAADDSVQQLERLEEPLGPLPLVLRAWFETIAEVDLRGSLADWSDPGPFRATSPLQGIVEEAVPYTDPLCVGPLNDLVEQANGRMAELAELEPDEGLLFAFAGDVVAKQEASGGIYGLLLPCSDFDTDVEVHRPTTFLDYLRESLAWGGFLGWANYQHPPVDRLEQLRRDFQPF